MSAPASSNEEASDRRVATLGDLLYAGSNKLHEPEATWTDLLDGITRGDQLALDALYGRTHRIVFTVIMRIVNNRETAEELTVDVFHEIWRKAASYEAARVSVIGWIMNQARSRAIDRLRFEQRKKRIPPALHEPDAQSDVQAADEALHAADQRRVLGQALANLTVSERQAIEAAFFCERSYADVAAHLDEPLGTIKTRIRSGLSKLRQVLDASAGPQ